MLKSPPPALITAAGEEPRREGPGTLIGQYKMLEEIGEGKGEKDEKQIVIHCALASFGQLQAAIEQRKLPLISAESEYVAQTPVQLPQEQAIEVLALVDALEQDDDVQSVFHNLA